MKLECEMHIFFPFLGTFDFNILWWSLNVKCNLSPLLPTFSNALNAHYIIFPFLPPLRLFFCCNCWNVLQPFLVPFNFWCCFIVAIDNCNNTNCYNCWNIFPTLLSPYNFWCLFIVIADVCSKISLVAKIVETLFHLKCLYFQWRFKHIL